jgi:3-hydroxyacyl-CoA dehydrogenase
METYVGLVEVGVGLIPSGGGLAYIARRAAEMAARRQCQRRHHEVRHRRLHQCRDGQGGHQRIESRKLGYLLDTDIIVPNKDELLFVAMTQAKAMFDSGYRPRTREGRVPGGRPQRHLPPSRASWPTCATAASSARTTSTSAR